MTDMIDNEKEDEYEFSGEEEYTPPEFENVGGPEVNLNAEHDLDVEPEAAPSYAELGETSPMMKILAYVGMGLGAVLIAVYMGYRDKGGDEEQGLPEQATVVKAPAIKAEPTPTPVAPAQLAATEFSPPSTAVQQVITGLSQSIKTNQLTIENVSARVGALESSVNNMNNTLMNLDSRLKTSMAPRSKPVVRKYVRTVKKPIVRKPVYRELFGLKAVVPGRAWIQTSSGQMMSVSIGDSIYGLGRVNAIDAPKGQVATSSGAVIVYGPGDF